MKDKGDFFLLHLSVFIAGFTGVLGRLISLNEAVLVWYRMFSAGLLLLAFLFFTKKYQKFSMRNILRSGGVGVLLALHWVFFYGSIKASNVSIGVVCFSLVGFFTALLEPLINKHKLSLHEFLFSFLTLLGIYLIFHFDSQYRLGICLGVASSVFYALFAIYNQRVGKEVEAKNMLLYEMFGGLIILSLLMPIYLHFIPANTFIPTGMDYLYLSILVIFCTIILCLMQIIVLQKISAFTVNLTYNLEPVYSIIISMILFQENKELNFSFYIGISLIIISVILQTIRIMKKRRHLEKTL